MATKTLTNKEKVYNLLKTRKWTSGAAIERAGGLRRLRELRGQYEIKSRRVPGSRAYEYRLVGKIK